MQQSLHGLWSMNELLKKALEKLTEEYEVQKELIKDISAGKLHGLQKRVESPASLKFNMATVLYGSIHGFTNILGHENTREYVDELDGIIFHFDEILKKYSIQKIKTIGDSYMAAGGIPLKNITNPIQVVMAALEMQDYINNLPSLKNRDEQIWEFRLGIHTGPVVSTISGKKKISYDIKGDTVNMTSRMESYSKGGAVLISGMTYELVKELFDCVYYGKMPVKYKADLDLYTVEGLKPEYSLNGFRSRPNEMFDTRYKLIQFTDIQEIILEKLEKELPPYLHYHNVKHTVDVVTEVELLGWAEGLSDEEILLLKTAGLFHDAGHIVSYENHEFHGTEIARIFLPDYGYSGDQIDKICEIIMATKMPPQPSNILQKIICDSDLDYLGRSDMIPVSNMLFKELKEQNKIVKFKDWNLLQLKFLTNHQYFTNTAQALREVNKQTQIERIRKLIEEDSGEE
jgi:adenylate cyclase